MIMKTCSTCNESKPLESNFYKGGSAYHDGYRNQCINCYRVVNKLYQSTDTAKKANLRKAYRKLVVEPEKVIARYKARYAAKKGIIHKPTECSDCGDGSRQIQGHHEDYNKPLEVIWLCPRCHTKIHNRLVDVTGVYKPKATPTTESEQA